MGDIAEVQRSLGRLEGTLGGLEDKLDSLAETMTTFAQNTRRDSDDLEKRVRFVEQFQKWAVGVASGISMVAGSVFYLLKTKTEGL